MYEVIFTKGNMEELITSFNDISLARDIKHKYENKPEYRDGLITIEETTGNKRKILF